MKSKSLSFIIAGIFAFVFLISFASAVTLSGPTTLSKDGGYIIVDVSSTNLNDTITLSIDNPYSPDITFSINENSFTLNNEIKEVNVSYIVSGFDFELPGGYSITLNAVASNSTDASKVLTFDSDFCKYDNPGNLRVTIDDITVKNGYGDDEEWLPLDEVEITIDVENKGNEDIDDIDLEWGIYDESNKEWIIEVDDVENFNLKDDDEETFTITFKVDESDLDIDLEDLEDGSYTLYVRATGEVDDSSNSDTCASDSADIDIVIEKDFVILTELEIPEELQCGSTLQISGEVWNIGSRDQDDVTIDIVNKKLGIDQYVTIGDIDALNSEDFNFNFEIPEDVEAGTYFIKFSVLDDDNDVYENDYDDELSQFEIAVKITGNCISQEDVDVRVVLEEGGQAGKTATLKATVSNTGEKTTTYLLNLAGYADWADSAQLSKTTLVLDAGESEDVTITLDINSEASGEKIFSLEVLSGSKLIATQPVSVDVIKKSFGITGFSINRDNWHLWGIGFLNVILVVLIIIIAVRVARK